MDTNENDKLPAKWLAQMLYSVQMLIFHFHLPPSPSITRSFLQLNLIELDNDDDDSVCGCEPLSGITMQIPPIEELISYAHPMCMR